MHGWIFFLVVSMSGSPKPTCTLKVYTWHFWWPASISWHLRVVHWSPAGDWMKVNSQPCFGKLLCPNRRLQGPSCVRFGNTTVVWWMLNQELKFLPSQHSFSVRRMLESQSPLSHLGPTGAAGFGVLLCSGGPPPVPPQAQSPETRILHITWWKPCTHLLL